MITKRITATTRLVSQFDDAFVLGFTEEQREKYLETLDIKELDGLEQLDNPPTVFICKPLQADYEYLIYSESVNPWHIFASHVESLEYCDEIKLTHNKQGVIKEEHHEDIPPRVIQDIAHMVISKANQSGDEVFFTQSVASLRYSQAVKIKDASKQRSELARMAAVTNKSLE